METARPPLTADALPARLNDVFRLLRRGRHICLDDGAVYRDLEREEDRYRVVFAGLGYDLVHHAQGFYYLKGGPSLSSKRLQAVTLFLLLLFQDLEENKLNDRDRSWVRTLTERAFSVESLPHFATTERRDQMAALGVTRESLAPQVLRTLKSLGMLEMIGDGRFRLRTPVYRFVDLVLEYADEDWNARTTTADAADEFRPARDDWHELGFDDGEPEA